MQKLNTSVPSVPTLTKEQAIIISAYTGITACPFGDFHEAVEKKLGYPVWTHQFGDETFAEKVKAALREDFLTICYGRD